MSTRKRKLHKKTSDQYEQIVDDPRDYFVRFPQMPLTMSFQDWRARRYPKLSLMTELRGNEREYVASAEIAGEARTFRESGDPLAVIKAVRAAVDAGVYPPIDILQALADAFRRYEDGKGAITLDQAFKGTKQGSRSMFTKRGNRTMARFVATLIFQAKIVFKESTAGAAERVQLALEHHTSWDLRYTADSLVRQYAKWKKEFRLDEADQSFYNHPNHPHLRWDPARRARFLAAPDFSLF